MAYNSTAKIIRCRDLDAISWVNTGAPAGLSGRAKSMFELLKTALLMNKGSSMLRTTVGRLCGRIVSAHVAVSCSLSTARRAIAELEEKGYLRRSQCRLGNASKGIEIVFQLERWAYWTQRQSGKVSPIPTSVYISPDQSMRPAEDRTTTTPVVNSQDLPKNVKIMQKPDKKIHQYDPILFTLWIVLKKSGVRIPHQDPVYRRAKFEIAAAAAGVEIPNPTGVPWNQYGAVWREMAKNTRESFAKSQILPFFASRSECGNVVSRETMCEHVGVRNTPTEEDPSQIRELIARSLEKVELPAPPPRPAPAPYPEIDLNDPAMRLLVETRDRVARGRINAG